MKPNCGKYSLASKFLHAVKIRHYAFVYTPFPVYFYKVFGAENFFVPNRLMFVTLLV